jgi:Tfp pilus assembly protein PilW
MKRPISGFSLVELLVATLICSFMTVTLIEINATAFRSQTRLFSDAAIENSATNVRRAVATALGSATFLEVPNAGAPLTNVLSVWDNTDPSDGSPMVGNTRTYTYLCADAAGNNFYKYRGSVVWPAGRPAIVCGQAAAGATQTFVAGSNNFLIRPRFFLPATETNHVQADCGIELRVSRLRYDKTISMQIQMSIRHATH